MSDTITVNITSADINVNVVEAGAIWGSINGTITNQTDLVNYISGLSATSPYIFAVSGTSILPVNGTNVIAATGTNSVITGGQHNTVSSYYSVIGGGGGNRIYDYGYNVIAGGQSNTISCCYNNFIGSGFLNTACGKAVSIVGGVCNTASGVYSAILGGDSNNTNNQACSFIIGQGITASLPNYTYVNNLSAPGNICAGTFYGDGSNLTGASLPGQAGINSLVTNTSGNWNTAYNVATSYSSVSSSFVTNTTVNTLTSLLTLTTTTRTLTGLLTPLTTTNTLTSLLLPTSVYQNASGSFATNTTVNTLTSLLVKTTDLNTLSGTLLTRTDANTLSSLLTPLTVTNTLTSLLVKTTDLNTLSATLLTRTDANTLSSLLLPTTIYQNASGNWQTAYQRVSANNLYLNANTTSLSALNATLVVQTISAASYIGVVATGGGGSGAYLPLSGGQLTGFVTSTSSVSAQGTFTATNIATNSQVQYLTGGTFVKVYQFYNSSTNSLDTVFN